MGRGCRTETAHHRQRESDRAGTAFAPDQQVETPLVHGHLRIRNRLGHLAAGVLHKRFRIRSAGGAENHITALELARCRGARPHLDNGDLRRPIAPDSLVVGPDPDARAGGAHRPVPPFLDVLVFLQGVRLGEIRRIGCLRPLVAMHGLADQDSYDDRHQHEFHASFFLLAYRADRPGLPHVHGAFELRQVGPNPRRARPIDGITLQDSTAPEFSISAKLFPLAARPRLESGVYEDPTADRDRGRSSPALQAPHGGVCRRAAIRQRAWLGHRYRRMDR